MVTSSKVMTKSHCTLQLGDPGFIRELGGGGSASNQVAL